ncbi:MAG: YggS family pyridoxal phosphate-dependent enzyme [Gammaproteobacteria bacterium]|nr:YggS family pyridoxal phosphate-dependent enzyme [Gammaproteobacteria bacterium]
MTKIEQRLHFIQRRIQHAAQQCERDTGSITLLAVSKKQPTSRILQAYQAGLTHFGESYVQESTPKINALADHPLTWHFIGPIQSNKTHIIAQHFDWVHCVQRIKIAQRLNEQRPLQLPPLKLCIQINISNEANKAGIPQNALLELAQQIKRFPRLQLRGLMAIPQKLDNPQQQRIAFEQLRSLMHNLNQQNFQLDTLSMGMTNDLEAAIIEGATIVRVGTGLFGPRNETEP